MDENACFSEIEYSVDVQFSVVENMRSTILSDLIRVPVVCEANWSRRLCVAYESCEDWPRLCGWGPASLSHRVGFTKHTHTITAQASLLSSRRDTTGELARHQQLSPCVMVACLHKLLQVESGAISLVCSRGNKLSTVGIVARLVLMGLRARTVARDRVSHFSVFDV
eukprot:6467014-Amphidinium_carterae.1